MIDKNQKVPVRLGVSVCDHGNYARHWMADAGPRLVVDLYFIADTLSGVRHGKPHPARGREGLTSCGHLQGEGMRLLLLEILLGKYGPVWEIICDQHVTQLYLLRANGAKQRHPHTSVSLDKCLAGDACCLSAERSCDIVAHMSFDHRSLWIVWVRVVLGRV